MEYAIVASLVIFFCHAEVTNVHDGSKTLLQITGLNSKALKSGDSTLDIDPNIITLYGMRFCPWCERVMLYAVKKGLRVNYININLASPPEWYKLKNPFGRVPTVEFHDKILWDSAVLCEFLDDYFTNSTILSKDPFEKARAKMVAAELSNFMPRAFYNLFEVYKGSNTSELMQQIKENLISAEKLLSKAGKFYNGETVGYADYLTIPFLERVYVLSHHVNITMFKVDDFPGNNDYPLLTRWFWLMTQLPEFEAITQPTALQLKWFESYAMNAPNYDIGLE